MPEIKRPKQEDYDSYRKMMRDRLEKLEASGQYHGLFPNHSEIPNHLNTLFSSLSVYLVNVPKDITQKDQKYFTTVGPIFYLAGGTKSLIKDTDLDYALDLKYLLESKAEDGRTQFENLIEFAYANNMDLKKLKSAASALGDYLCLDLQVPDVSLELVPNPGLKDRGEEKKTALEWISEFKNNAREAVAAANGGGEPDTDWIINTLAVRSLAKSVRHKSGKLKEEKFTGAEIMERANRLMADEQVRSYIDHLKQNPQEYARAAGLLQKGNGGRLEDQITAFQLAKKRISYSYYGKRYRPTAKQMIETMQARLRNPESSQEEKREALASIIAVRKELGVKRATLGMIKNTNLNNKIINYPGFQRSVERTAEELDRLSPQERSSLMEAACDGHGGAMVESFNELKEQKARQPVQAEPQVRQPQS